MGGMESSSGLQKHPTVVGIGASAGGLAALKTFFANIPPDSGVAFVVVVHLSPEHKSHLAAVLQPHVRFPVQQVTEDTSLEANHLYIIPPNANLSTIDTHLRLSQLEEHRRERAPIDYFFRTLAKAHDGHSIAVILTGTGTDGTLGIKEIKNRGGMVFVQDPNEAEYDGMPQSAIASGMADRILPVGEIAEAILRIRKTEPRVPPLKDGEELIPDPETFILHKVITQLRARTDRDFSRYKPATMLRRIARRMQLNYIPDPHAYVDKLHHDPDEVRALADDLLITVTSFFRDPEVFEYLSKNTLPRLFENKRAEDKIRVWSVGCATGEEAYSLAILLCEEASRRETPPRIQLFASDLHRSSLDKAREGFYPGDIETDVSDERLERFFQKEDGGFRIRKELRDLVVFAPHNVLGDPPFSKLDLIACRNLLIYLQRGVQREVIELFHYALNPDGVLILGSAENADAQDLFRTDSKRLCVYRKMNVPGPEPRLPVFPLNRIWNKLEGGLKRPESSEPVAYEAIHNLLLDRYGPPSLLLGPDNNVVHLSDRVGRFLNQPGGEPTTNMYKLIRGELRLDLQAAVQDARETQKPVETAPAAVSIDGQHKIVTMHVQPSRDAEQHGFVLVCFEEHADKSNRPESAAQPALSSRAAKRVGELEAELSRTKQRLQTVVEEYETSQEGMKAANEEMQSTNEELRSTMEELETSKEELQSINEELQTVNQENRHKIEEFSQLSADLQNLLIATDIGTLFLDRELRILRFTPSITELFNIRSADRDRPISDLTHRLGYPELRADAESVLNRLIPVEREVRDDAGRWYLTRVLPYRSQEDRIEGIVLTFVDITNRKKTEAALVESEARLAGDLAGMRRLYDLHVKLANEDNLSTALGEILAAAIEFAGTDRGTIQLIREDGEHLDIVSHRGYAPGSRFIEHFREGSKPACDAVRTQRARLIVEDVETFPALAGTEDGEVTLREGIRATHSTPLISRSGNVLGVLSTQFKSPHRPNDQEIRLIELLAWTAAQFIERHSAEAALRSSEAALRVSEERLQRVLETDAIGVIFFDYSGTLLDANDVFLRITGYTREQIANRELSWQRMTPPEWVSTSEQEVEKLLKTGRIGAYEKEYFCNDGSRRWMLFAGRDLGDGTFSEFCIDVTDRRLAEAALQQSEQRFRLFVENVREYALVQTDLEALVTSWNPGAERLFGYTSSEMVGSPFSLLLTPEDRAAGVAEQEYAHVRGGGHNEDARWLQRKDHTRFWGRWFTEPVRDEAGQIRGVAKVLRDETERMRSEEEIRSSERQFYAVANLVPDLVWKNDAEGKTIWTNQRWTEYTGKSGDEMRDFGWREVIHPDDRERSRARFRESVEMGHPLRQEHRLRRRDGEYRWFLTQLQPIRDDSGRVLEWFGSATDIHDQKIAMSAVQGSLAEKEALLKEVHHRVKNNLQVITSLLNMQARQVEEPQMLALFEEARNRVVSIASIHELLYQSASFASIDMVEYAEQLGRDLLRFYGAEKRIEFSVEGQGVSLELERAVPYGLLLNELLSNACKHAFPGQGSGKVSVALHRVDHQMVLQVSDTGIGLPNGFDYRKTTSLGLQLVHTLARQLGAALTIGSGPGTIVRLSLPLKMAADSEDGAN